MNCVTLTNKIQKNRTSKKKNTTNVLHFAFLQIDVVNCNNVTLYTDRNLSLML